MNVSSFFYSPCIYSSAFFTFSDPSYKILKCHILNLLLYQVMLILLLYIFGLFFPIKLNLLIWKCFLEECIQSDITTWNNGMYTYIIPCFSLYPFCGPFYKLLKSDIIEPVALPVMCVLPEWCNDRWKRLERNVSSWNIEM